MQIQEILIEIVLVSPQGEEFILKLNCDYWKRKDAMEKQNYLIRKLKKIKKDLEQRHLLILYQPSNVSVM